MNNVAIITLATNQRYLKGAYNLYKCYLKLNSKYPFYCAVWEETDTHGFEDMPMIIVEKIVPKTRIPYSYCLPIDMFSKFSLFLLKQFDYILFLDADIILYKNLDNEIDDYIKNNYNIAMYVNDNCKDIYSYFWSGIIFFKPNKNVFINALKYLPLCKNDEYLFFMLHQGYKINITPLYENTDNPGFLHLQEDKQKKYWEKPLTTPIKDCLNKEIPFNTQN